MLFLLPLFYFFLSLDFITYSQIDNNYNFKVMISKNDILRYYDNYYVDMKLSIIFIGEKDIVTANMTTATCSTHD